MAERFTVQVFNEVSDIALFVRKDGITNVQSNKRHTRIASGDIWNLRKGGRGSSWKVYA